MSSPHSQCSVDECERHVHAAGMCRTHYERKRLGKPLTAPVRQWGNPARTFAEAMFAFTDAADNDEDAYFRAWKRVCTAGRRYFGTK